MNMANTAVEPLRKTIRASLIVAGTIICALTVTGGDWIGADASFLVYPYCLLAVALGLWALWTWRLQAGSLFTPYIIFFAMAWLFNAGQTLLEVLNLNPDGLLEGRFSSGILISTLQLVILGLASLHVGTLVSCRGMSHAGGVPKLPESPDIGSIDPERPRELKALKLVGYALLCISTVPMIILFRASLGVVTSSGYMGLYQQNAITGLQAWPAVLGTFFPSGVLCLLLASSGRGVTFVVSLAGILLYSVVTFFLGHRAYAAMPLVAYIWAYHHSVRRIPMSVICACAALLLFVVFPLVRVSRNETGRTLSSLSGLFDAYGSIDNPVSGTVSEMGWSMSTVAYTLELVPTKRPFDLGIGYLYSLLTLVPNFFWDVHPSVARMDAATWLTWEVSPSTALQGEGLGFSCIAEAYLNFGWIGTPIVLFLIGFGLGKLSTWSANSDRLSKVTLTAWH